MSLKFLLLLSALLLSSPQEAFTPQVAENALKTWEQAAEVICERDIVMIRSDEAIKAYESVFKKHIMGFAVPKVDPCPIFIQKTVDPELEEMVILHEVGHCLMGAHHSKHEESIMRPYVTKDSMIYPRDVRALRTKSPFCQLKPLHPRN